MARPPKPTFRLHRRLRSAAVRRAVRPQFHSELPWPELALGETAVLIFQRKELVNAATIQQVLAAIGDMEEPCKIGVAANFTKEAAELLAAKGFCVPTKREPASESYPIPFPQPVHYSRTDQPSGWDIKDWATANSLLGCLEPVRRHYALFDLPDGSYIQCLGRKQALTVEARVYGADGSFTHWVFGKGGPCGLRTQVGGALGVVTVDRTQVLQMRDARVIIRQFLETRTFPEQYYRQDVTERYTGPLVIRDDRLRPSLDWPPPARRV